MNDSLRIEKKTKQNHKKNKEKTRKEKKLKIIKKQRIIK